MKKYCLLVGLTFLLSCGDDAVDPNALLVSQVEQELLVINNSFDDLYIAVFPESIIHVIDWVPVISEENKLPSREVMKLPLNQVSENFGELPSDENLVFYYWKAVINGGKLVPGPINSLVFDPD